MEESSGVLILSGIVCVEASLNFLPGNFLKSWTSTESSVVRQKSFFILEISRKSNPASAAKTDFENSRFSAVKNSAIAEIIIWFSAVFSFVFISPCKISTIFFRKCACNSAPIPVFSKTSRRFSSSVISKIKNLEISSRSNIGL